MKKILTILLIVFAWGMNAQVIGADMVNFTVKTEVQMNAITVAQGLQEGSICYRSDTESLWRYNGTAWAEITGSYVDLSNNQTVGGNKTFTGESNFTNIEFTETSSLPIGVGIGTNSGKLTFRDAVGNQSFIFNGDNLTGVHTYTLQDTNGTIALTSDVSGLLSSNNSWTGTQNFTNTITTTGTVNLQNSDIALPGNLTDVNSQTIVTGGSDPAGSATIMFNPSGTPIALTATPTDITYNGTSLTASGGSTPPFDDTTSLVQDPVDNTKQVRIDAGAITTATTRTITMPDADVDLGGLTSSNLGTNSVGTDEIDLSISPTWSGQHRFNGITTYTNTLDLGDGAHYFGVDAGVSGQRWGRDLDASGHLRYKYQSASGTDYGGSYTNLYTLNNTGTPSASTDLINVGYLTASNMPITDSGANYTGTTVEAALTEIADSLAVQITSDITGVTGGIAIKNLYLQTEAGQDTDGTPPTGVASLCIDCSPAKVVATATIAMDGWKMYDDQTADAATITLSDCDPGETLTVYINRASAPTLAGTGLTFNQLPSTTAFAAATEMMIIFEVAYDGTTIDYYYVER